ncbi:hypothetical protein JHK85_034786 [Glycine max]|nr:hypothetical protein JHK85_034786 [Glycine max]
MRSSVPHNQTDRVLNRYNNKGNQKLIAEEARLSQPAAEPESAFSRHQSGNVSLRRVSLSNFQPPGSSLGKLPTNCYCTILHDMIKRLLYHL